MDLSSTPWRSHHRSLALLAAAVLAAPAQSEELQTRPEPVVETVKDAAASDERFAWALLPDLGFNSDDGFGAGLIGKLFWYEKGITPYKYSLFGQFYMTNRQVQIHFLKFDAVEVLDLPLRIWGELGHYATIANNYCGVGNQVSCDPAVPEALAAAQGLNAQESATFVDRYYKIRYMRPYAMLNGRWRLSDSQPKLEVMVGWRGFYHLTGAIGELRPYPGSLYARDFPDGESGLSSVVQAGLMLDARDDEIAPTRGYWVEASLRGASSVLGSAWSYVGANLILRGYVPLDRARNAVLAGRLIVDATAGDLPTHELALIGGSRILSGVGGEFSGRGLRLERYIGRFKAVAQTELRFTLWRFSLWQQNFSLGGVGFFDAAAVGYDWSDWRGDPRQILWGAGAGPRLTWNRDFIFKVDVGLSPFESKAPAVYLNLGHVF